MPPGPGLEVVATREGQIWMAGESVVPPCLVKRVAAEVRKAPAPVVLVTADVEAPFLNVFRIHVACERAGVRSFFWRYWAGGAPHALPAPPFPAETKDRVDSVELQLRDGVTFVNVLDPRFRPRRPEGSTQPLTKDLRRLRGSSGFDAISVVGLDVSTFGDVFSVALAAQRAGYLAFGLKCRHAASFDSAAPGYRPPPAPAARPLLSAVEVYLSAGTREEEGATILSAADEKTRAAVTPPRQTGEALPGGIPFMEILVTADRRFFVAGRQVDTEGLRQLLEVHTVRSGTPLEKGVLSQDRVLIHADGEAFFEDMRSALAACRSADVGIHRVRLAVRDGKGRLRSLPIDQPTAKDSAWWGKSIRLRLLRSTSEPAVRLGLFDVSLGRGDEAFTRLAAQLADVRRQLGHPLVVVDAWRTVRVSDVVRAVSILHETGWPRVRFEE
jgi:biopolymer transport protein ExbD